MGRGLSKQQAEVLVLLGDQLCAMRQRVAELTENPTKDNTLTEIILPWFADWEASWRYGVPYEKQCRRASLSRSLKRLELRGLVLRQKRIHEDAARKSPKDIHIWTIKVQLTPSGWDVYYRLTKTHRENTN
jgi:hypothetical protein